MSKKITKNLSDTLNTIGKIKNDCDMLEKKGDLTEYGRGQLGLINIISKELDDEKD